MLKAAVKQKDHDRWNDHLQTLSVQGKYKQITELEEETNSWKQKRGGLPVGQLSFLLRVGSDTLPTTMNLHQWRIVLSPNCYLCNSRQAMYGCSYFQRWKPRTT